MFSPTNGLDDGAAQEETSEASGRDLMKALSTIPAMKLACIDEAFVLLDSGLGAIFSASMARRAAIDRTSNKLLDKGPSTSSSEVPGQRGAAGLWKKALKFSSAGKKKHAAQEVTMQMVLGLAEGGDQPPLRGPGHQANFRHEFESSQTQGARLTAMDEALPADPAVMEWAEKELGLSEEQLSWLKRIENSKSWHAHQKHKMLCWEAQQLSKFDNIGAEAWRHEVDQAAGRNLVKLSDKSLYSDVYSSPEKEKSLSTSASTVSLATNRSSPLSIATTASTHCSMTPSPCLNSPAKTGMNVAESLANAVKDFPVKTTHEPSVAFEAAKDSLFGLSSYSSAQRARRSRAPIAPVSALQDVSSVDSPDSEGGATSSRSVPEGSSPRIAKTLLTRQTVKWPGRERSLPPLALPSAVTDAARGASVRAGCLTERSHATKLPSIVDASGEPSASVTATPHSARAKGKRGCAYGHGEGSPFYRYLHRCVKGHPHSDDALEPLTSPESLLPAGADKWADRLDSCGQARDLAAGASLRYAPHFVEPHQAFASSDMSCTPEFMYFRRCAARGIVPNPGVWSHLSGAGIINASGRSLKDDEVATIIDTAVACSEEHALHLLDLSRNALTDVGLEYIARLIVPWPSLPPIFRQLRTLNLAGNRMLKFRTAGMLEMFVAALRALPQLESLDLSSIQFRAQVEKLCAALQRCISLKSLSLADCGIGLIDQKECVAAAALLGERAGSCWEGLARADFSYNFFARPGLAVAATAIQKSRIASISFSNNGTSRVRRGSDSKEPRFHPLQLLFEGLQFNMTLTALDVSNCGLGPDSAFVLENAARSHPYLNSCDLSDNPLGEVGLRCAIRLVLTPGTKLRSVSVVGAREADAASHAVKLRLSQPGGIYQLNLRYPHERLTLIALLRYHVKSRSLVFQYFRFDAKCGKPHVTKDPATNNWVVPTSGTFSFSFQPPVSRTASSAQPGLPSCGHGAASNISHDSIRNTAPQHASLKTSQEKSSTPSVFLVRGAGGAIPEAGGSAITTGRQSVTPSAVPAQHASRTSLIGGVRQSLKGGEAPKRDSRMGRMQAGTCRTSVGLGDWTEIDVLLGSKRCPVAALQFPVIRGMFLSMVTREQQLRFTQACSKDMSFNYAQACRLCKDRPEIISDLVTSLFPSISSTASQLMLLGTLPPSVASAVSQEVRPSLWFQPGNLTGTHRLDLLKPAHYAVAEDCLLINAWESELSRVLHFPDVSQRGNYEMLRNEVHNEAPFAYGRDWTLPTQGVLFFDFSSIRRPASVKAPTHEATEVTRYMQRKSASHEAKIRALRAISTHLYMSTRQFKNLVQIFPKGTMRQDFFCMFHTRVIDPVRFLGPDMLYNTNIFSAEDRSALFGRIGALHLLNHMCPEGVKYYCNLSVYEERAIVEFLVQLSIMEPGGKVMGAINARPEDGLIFQKTPATWERKVPSEGTIVCCYESVAVKKEARQALAEQYCVGSLSPTS